MSLMAQLIKNLIDAVRHIYGLTVYFRTSGIRFCIPSLDLKLYNLAQRPRACCTVYDYVTNTAI